MLFISDENFGIEVILTNLKNFSSGHKHSEQTEFDSIAAGVFVCSSNTYLYFG